MLQLIIKQHFPVQALLETAQLAVGVLIPLPLGSGAVKRAFLMSREVRPCLCSNRVGHEHTEAIKSIGSPSLRSISHICISHTAYAIHQLICLLNK